MPGVRYVRRTEDVVPRDLALPCVVLLDSIGELASLFPLADVVFMGGTLARRGGHNVLEPAAVRRAIVTGPHLENFRAIAAEFREQRAFLEINEASELAGRRGAADRPATTSRRTRRARGCTRRGKAWRNAESRGRDSPPARSRRSPSGAIEPGAIPAVAIREDLGACERAGTAPENRRGTASEHARDQRWRHQHGWGGQNSAGGSSRPNV